MSLGEWDGKTQFGLFDKYDTFEKEDQPFFAIIILISTLSMKSCNDDNVNTKINFNSNWKFHLLEDTPT